MSRADTFNRADSATSLGTPSDGGSAWTARVGTWGISTNQGYNPTGDSGALAVLADTAADADVQVTVNTDIADDGVVARESGGNNLILWRGRSAAGLGYDLYKEVAGSFTALATGLGTAAAGDVVKLSVSGSTLKGYVNGVLLTTQTDGAGATNTNYGIRASSDNAARFNDFSIMDAAATVWVPTTAFDHVPRGTQLVAY